METLPVDNGCNQILLGQLQDQSACEEEYILVVLENIFFYN